MNTKKENNSKEKKKFRLSGLLYHNSFVLACSFAVALVSWFVIAAGSDMNRTYVIRDVPVNVSLSSQAEADGLRVFNQSYNTVDIEVSGSSLITRALTADDFEVTVALNPTSTKLTGNTTQKLNASVRVAKQNSYSDYEIVSVSPEEITLEYDRFKETTLNIETDISFTAGTGFYAGTPALSEEKITVSGPESAVNKVSRAIVTYSLDNPLREDDSRSWLVKLFDQDNQEISDLAELYLSRDVDSVQVTIPVRPKKTVPLIVSTAHVPADFSSARITVEPESVELAGSAETLGSITEIRLNNVIDFAELDLDQRTASFTMEIPLPPGTQNLTSSGANTVSQAKVTVNLNGYRKTTVSVPESNVQMLNAPTGDLEAMLTTRTLEVTLAGPEAQVNRLTGDSVMVQVDMSNVEARSGSVDVPVTVSISGTAGDACWVLGSYTMTVTMRAAGNTTPSPGPSLDAGD
ncbi:CdaR family protein [Acutalibacter caecimuris]|uniref:CdaR family protein n=1 Tax=Acutalibacter caecimuris TaxID=3093657 RepID=UPI002AC9972B|nr:CdaR family protein [Acutalibacter sp. M00118]